MGVQRTMGCHSVRSQCQVSYAVSGARLLLLSMFIFSQVNHPAIWEL